jgi:hypothetical protein
MLWVAVVVRSNNEEHPQKYQPPQWMMPNPTIR